MSARQRVAILGGGAGSMTAAYYLSATPERRAQFDVTVYQLGWRLGGKGASGRNADVSQRIEEHGLHVWGGFYANAFRTMRACYADLNRPAGTPLATVEDAFIAAPHVVWEEQIDGGWRTWPVEPPVSPGLPGEGGELPTAEQYIELLIDWVHERLSAAVHPAVHVSLRSISERLLHGLRDVLEGVDHVARDIVDGTALSAFRAALALARSVTPASGSNRYDAVLGCLEAGHEALKRDVMEAIDDHDDARRLFVMADLALAVARGLIADRIFERGFTAIDDEDLSDWLKKHGAVNTGLESAPLRGFYDYFFAYEDGDPSKPRMSAAMGLYHLLRLAFTYKCSLFFKMTSGMGDAVFGPLYETCRRNGVTFRFFHEVTELVPDASATRIATIRLLQQVETKGEYAPLVTVNGLPSWPSKPQLNQIRDDQAARLRDTGCDLEDPHGGWDGGTAMELQEGRDFDLVVLGIPVGAHRTICARLMDARPEWRSMVDQLATIQTQALQLWWTSPITALGASAPLATGTAYGQPLESWSDMSHVLVRETWPAGPGAPQGVVYFCGPMLTQRLPTGSDPHFAEGQLDAARRIAEQWCDACLPHLYPGSMAGAQIDWNALVAPEWITGEARFTAQYHRANCTPSERYVLDLPGTSRYRLNADASGFENLLLAGDWVFTGLGGAVESAVIAGMQAAQAIIGQPLGVIGALANPWSTLPRYRVRP